MWSSVKVTLDCGYVIALFSQSFPCGMSRTFFKTSEKISEYNIIRFPLVMTSFTVDDKNCFKEEFVKQEPKEECINHVMEIKVEKGIKQEIEIQWHELNLEENPPVALKLDRVKMWKCKLSKELTAQMTGKHLNAAKAKWFECGKCDFKTKYRHCLQPHIICKHLNEDEIDWIKCAKCDYKTKQKQCLTNHVSNKHHPREIKWFECEKCEYKTKDKYYLQKHTASRHANEYEMRWKCERCDYKARLKKNVQLHVIFEHPDAREIKWFKCEECVRKYRHKVSLKQHMIKKHQDASKIK